MDLNLQNISDTSDEEEDDALSSPPQGEINSSTDIDSKHAPLGEVETQPTGEGAVPKTEPCIAGKRSGNKEDAARIADEKWKTYKEKSKNGRSK